MPCKENSPPGRCARSVPDAVEQSPLSLDAVIALTHGIAHDFNNVLGVIVGNTEMVLEGESEREEAVYCLEQVLKAAEHAQRLLRQLPVYPPHSAAQTETQELQLGCLIKGALQLLYRESDQRFRFHYRIPPGGVYVHANLFSAYRMLSRIFTFAEEYSREDAQYEVTVTEEQTDDPRCAAWSRLDGGRCAKISVAIPGADSPESGLLHALCSLKKELQAEGAMSVSDGPAEDGKTVIIVYMPSAARAEAQ